MSAFPSKDKILGPLLYHQHGHLETSPGSAHRGNEGPAVLLGVVALHRPQTLLSVVPS